MKKILILSLVLVLASALPANASRHYHIVKPSHAKVARYGYVYHRHSTVKCPFAGCRRSFSH